MEIRYVDQEDLPYIKHMWKYCFDDTKEFVDWYFEEKYNSDDCLGVYENNIVVSNLQLIPYSMEYLGLKINTNYIIGVASLPEVRGRGYVSMLMKYSLQEMRKRKIDISLLLPFNYGFYRKYGWETCYNHKRYEIKLERLKDLILNYGTFREADYNNDINVLNSIYNKYVKNKAGYIVRNEYNWKCLINDFKLEGMVVYIIERNSVPEGYIVFGINDNIFNAFEIAYTNGQAFRGILNFIYSHYSQAEKMTWNGPEDNMLSSYLDKESLVWIRPFVMARVVDVKKVIEQICSINNNTEKFTLKINDKYAQWNDNVFVIDGKKISVNDNIDPDAEMSVNIFTQLAMGFLTINEVNELGLIKKCCEKSFSIMEKLFIKRNNYINEYY